MAKKPDKLALAYQTVLNNPEGRMVVWDLLQYCGVFRSDATPETNRKFFFEGRRDAGLMVLNKILEIDPNIFVAMMREKNPTSFPIEPAETTDEDKETDNAE